MSDVLKHLLAILAFLAKAYPEIAEFLSGVANGDSKCVDELRKTLPMESESAKALREMQRTP